MNRLEHLTVRGCRSALGMFILSADPFIMEACTSLPLDWVALDMEASALAKPDLLRFLMAAKGEQVRPFVRVADSRPETIEQALDLGAMGIIVPKVHDRETAEIASQACFYPDKGNRGVNPVRVSRYFDDVPGYFQRANDQTFCFVQIESARAVEDVDAILEVSDIDGVFIGCGDLAMSLGTPGKVDSGPMQEAIGKVLNCCKHHDRIPGIFAYDLDLANRYLKQGFRFVAIGNDIKALKVSVNGWMEQINSGF